MVRAAAAADPPSLGKLQVLPMTAKMARLGGGKEAIDFDHLAAVPPPFVFQHPGEGAVRRVAEALGQLGFHEDLEAQLFDANGIVVADDPGGQFVQPVLPPVADPGIANRKALAGLAAIAAALPTARKPAMEAFELP